MDVLLLSHLQFAFTIMFLYLSPLLTIGMFGVIGLVPLAVCVYVLNEEIRKGPDPSSGGAAEEGAGALLAALGAQLGNRGPAAGS